MDVFKDNHAGDIDATTPRLTGFRSRFLATYGDTNRRLRGWCHTVTSETGHSWHHFAGFIGPVSTARAQELRWLFPCLGAPCAPPSLTCVLLQPSVILVATHVAPCSSTLPRPSVRRDLPLLARMCGALGARWACVRAVHVHAPHARLRGHLLDTWRQPSVRLCVA